MTKYMEFKENQKIALEIRDEYGKLNERKGERRWSASEQTQAIVADVGDLNNLLWLKVAYAPLIMLMNYFFIRYLIVFGQ
jgi:hypothetical protein